MSDLARFGVSLEKDLLKRFDSLIREESFSSRSEAIKSLILKELVKKDWSEDKTVAGIISFVFDHHKRDLAGRLTDVQHGYSGLIVSSQHIHLDHDNCLEIIIARGSSAKIKKLSTEIRALKGVMHCQMIMTMDACEAH